MENSWQNSAVPAYERYLWAKAIAVEDPLSQEYLQNDSLNNPRWNILREIIPFEFSYEGPTFTPPEVAIFLGTPGSGKTELAKVVARRLNEIGHNAIYLEMDQYYWGVDRHLRTYHNPFSYDKDLFGLHIPALYNGYGINAPVYKTRISRRIDECRNISFKNNISQRDKSSVTGKNFMVIAGMVSNYFFGEDSRFSTGIKADYMFGMNVEFEDAYKRVIARSKYKGKNPIDKSFRVITTHMQKENMQDCYDIYISPSIRSISQNENPNYQILQNPFQIEPEAQKMQISENAQNVLRTMGIAY